jgi:hypothetical protein
MLAAVIGFTPKWQLKPIQTAEAMHHPCPFEAQIHNDTTVYHRTTIRCFINLLVEYQIVRNERTWTKPLFELETCITIGQTLGAKRTSQTGKK